MTRKNYTEELLNGGLAITVTPHQFVELLGKHSTAAMLYRLVYWDGKSKRTGKHRITPDENGERWLAKRAKDWYDECQIKVRTAQRAIAQLKDMGIIETKVKKWAGVPTTYIRLNVNRLMELLNSQSSNTDTPDYPEEITPICHSGSSQDDIATPPLCHSPLRHEGGDLYTITTNNKENTQQDPPPSRVCNEIFEEEEVGQSEDVSVKKNPPEKPRKRDKDKTQSLATQSNPDEDQYSAVEEKIKSLGIPPGTVRRLIKKYWNNVEDAIAAVKERLEQGGVRNPIGLLKTAIAEGWKPIKEVVGSTTRSIAAMTRQQWWDWLKEEKGLEWRQSVIVRVIELAGEDIVFLKSGEQMRLSEAKKMDLNQLFELGCAF